MSSPSQAYTSTITGSNVALTPFERGIRTLLSTQQPQISELSILTLDSVVRSRLIPFLSSEL